MEWLYVEDHNFFDWFFSVCGKMDELNVEYFLFLVCLFRGLCIYFCKNIFWDDGSDVLVLFLVVFSLFGY